MTDAGWLLALLIALALPAHAAGFDCTQARTPIERRVCAEPVLDAADTALAAAWRDALAVSLDRPALREEQRRWRRDPNAPTADLLASYRQRTDQLNAVAAAWRGLPTRIPATQCFVTPESDPGLICRIDASGPVEGDPALTWQGQSFYDGTLRVSGGAVLFAGSRPALAAYADTAHYDPPSMVTSAEGTLLQLPGHLEGTGNFNAGRLYIRHGAAWDDIDTDAWLADLARRLPAGLAARKGIYPDYRTLTATTPLWRGADGECCASGGRAAIRLGLKDRRLVLQDLRLVLGRRAAEQP